MSQQTFSSNEPQPPLDDHDAWLAYWQARGQNWRSQPEIDIARQEFLTQRLALTPDIEKGQYRFGDIKLERADIEWLTERSLTGGESISQNAQAEKESWLDLRGADLRRTDLRALPLTGLRGGLVLDPGELGVVALDINLVEAAAVHLEGALLAEAHLERSELWGAHLEGADLHEAHLEGADLHEAHLEGASFRQAYLEGAYLTGALLSGAFLSGAYLEGASLWRADLRGANLSNVHLAGASLRDAHLEGASLRDAHLEGKQIPTEDLFRISQWKPGLPQQMPPVDLRGAFMDSATNLEGINLGDAIYGFARVADVRWGGANLIVVNWASVEELGDELEARRVRSMDRQYGRQRRLDYYLIAVRANRQVAIALREQGLNEEAARFAYRAERLQRVVLFWEATQRHPDHPLGFVRRLRRLGAYLLSLLLDVFAGHGYRPELIFGWYVAALVAFAEVYYALGLPNGQHLTWGQALIVSLTAFHGRVFTEQFKPSDPQGVVAAIEAVFGLFIEAILIATFTQRFFEK